VPDTRLALRLEYDGAAYAGSQLQPGEPTVQGALEQALARLTGSELRADFAGRTDAGVHAIGQVAAFTTERPDTREGWLSALNGLLPADIAVTAIAEVPLNFDPRRDARRRWYRYSILNRRPRGTLSRGHTWHVPQPLCLPAMQEAALCLVGRHDFAAFSGALEPGRTTLRTIFRSCVSRSRDNVRFDVVGDAFLPQQVRRMTGALVRVGQEKMSVDDLAATLEQAEHGSSRHLAPPDGLCLMRVYYEGLDFGDGNDEDL
jgi:tRNA pseudouridine38-40 synthase